MNLMNDSMRKYAKEKLGVAADATDEVIKKALGDALVEGKIDQAAWTELQGNKTPSAGTMLRTIIREEMGGRTHTVKARATTPNPMTALSGVRVVGRRKVRHDAGRGQAREDRPTRGLPRRRR